MRLIVLSMGISSDLPNMADTMDSELDFPGVDFYASPGFEIVLLAIISHRD